MSGDGPSGIQSAGSSRPPSVRTLRVEVPIRYGPFAGSVGLPQDEAEVFLRESTFVPEQAAATSAAPRAGSPDGWRVDAETTDFGAALWSRRLDERIAAQGAARVLRFGGLVLHASAVELDGAAYIFTAHSGTGKSTTAGKLSPPARLLADDQCVLMPSTGSNERGAAGDGSGSTSWTCTDVRPGTVQPVPVRAVFLLERGTATGLHPVPTKVAFRRLLSHLVLAPGDAFLHGLAMDSVERLLLEVPCRIARVSLHDLSPRSLGMNASGSPGVTDPRSAGATDPRSRHGHG